MPPRLICAINPIRKVFPTLLLIISVQLGTSPKSFAQNIAEVSRAVVKRSDGTVQIVEKNGTVSDAYVEAVLTPGQTLRTGSNGSAEIALQGNGAVRVEVDSEVETTTGLQTGKSSRSLEHFRSDPRKTSASVIPRQIINNDHAAACPLHR